VDGLYFNILLSFPFRPISLSPSSEALKFTSTKVFRSCCLLSPLPYVHKNAGSDIFFAQDKSLELNRRRCDLITNKHKSMILVCSDAAEPVESLNALRF